MKHAAIVMVEKEKAELRNWDAEEDLAPDQVRGKTLYSLISPGTEITISYQGYRTKFPNYPGYSAVFRAEDIGEDVKGVETGQLLFCMGGHASIQTKEVRDTVIVPEGLSAEHATIARLMGVSMTTLVTTTARPGDVVLVVGAGPVGYLAAHQFNLSGYDVHVVEPLGERREIAENSGLQNVYVSMEEAKAVVFDKVALTAECSANERAIIDACRMSRRGAEVVLIGVPRTTEDGLPMAELVDAVFRRYVRLRSGWEWEVPHHAQHFMDHHTIYGGFHKALNWLAQGRIPIEGLIEKHDPAQAQATYQALMKRETTGLFHLHDWTKK